MRGLRRALAAGGTLLALAGTALAAESLVGTPRPPASAAVTIDSSAPLFQADGLVGGQSMDRCTTLTNEGPQPADVTLFGEASNAALSPWLHLELVRGTLPAGTGPGDCTGFVDDTADYGTGTPGVVFRGTLDALPSSDAGIADPTRWAVGERHSYRLHIDYTGDDPAQGLTTVQSFAWGATPFDDRPYTDPGSGPGGGGGGGQGPKLGRTCTVITFRDRDYIGARAISRPTRVKKTKKRAAGKRAPKASGSKASQSPSSRARTARLTSTLPSVVAAGEDAASLGAGEIAHRAELLGLARRQGGTAATKDRTLRGSTARRMPVLVVRLAPSKDGTIGVRVGLRKNGRLFSPKRWRWVRFRLNYSATKSTLRWPFTGTAKTNQLKLGYNQLDLALDRGGSATRLKGTKGLPRVMRRSYGFIVGEPGTPGASSADCTLG